MNPSDLQVKPSLAAADKVGYFFCPACDGSGWMKSGSKPQLCSFSQQGHAWAWVDGRWIYWNRELTAKHIFEREITRTVHLIVDGVLLLLGIIGIIGLVISLLSVSEANGDYLELLTERRGGILLFWFSLFTDCYAYFRLEQQALHRQTVRPMPLHHTSLNPPLAISWSTLTTQLPKETQEVSSVMNSDALKSIDLAWLMARKLGHRQVLPVHLLATLMTYNRIGILLGRLGTHPDPLLQRIDHLLKGQSGMLGLRQPVLSQALMTVFLESYVEASRADRPQISVTELFIALAKVEDLSREVLLDMNLTLNKLRNVSEWIHIRAELATRVKRWSGKASLKPKGIMNRAMTARPTPTLDSVSSDLTLQARAGAFFPLVGRKQELKEILRVFEEAIGNVLIVGEPGVGKTALVQGLAEVMASEEVPRPLQDKRLVSIYPGAMVAGASSTGVLEQRVMQMLSEVITAGNVVLAIENIHELVGAGTGGGGEDVANIIADLMSKAGFKVIATTTPEYYRQYLENNASLVRRFSRLDLEEVKGDDAIQVVEAHSAVIEARQKVFFAYDAIEASVQLSDRYLPELFLPAKALDLLEEAAVYGRNEREEKTMIGQEDVAEIIAQKTHIDVKEVSQDEAEKLLGLEDHIHERMINQEEAVRAVAAALRRSRESLRDPNRPIANFLFLGPTGVGKTELAKTIAAVYFGDEANMTRVDMSEYQDPASIERLIGSPHVQSGGGYLTEAIRHHPFSLILLDELEKAHPDILNLFLQLMDDGRLTDGGGRTIDATNIILVATSNAGTLFIQQSLEKGNDMKEIKKNLIERELQQFYRPEFLNRFDEVIVFTPLSMENIIDITKLQLKKIEQRMKAKGIGFEASADAVVELAQAGYDPKFGARPLRRVVQNKVEDVLAEYLLKGQIHRRDLVILQKDGKIEIRKAQTI